MRHRHILQPCCILLLLGMSLTGMIFFASPSKATPVGGFGFFHTALASLGLCLIIEAVGTLMAVMNRKFISASIYCLHFIPVLGMLLGIFCLIRALL